MVIAFIKYLFRYNYLYIAPFLFIYGCSPTFVDDTNNNCTIDCTTLKGRFITKNNVGVKGVKISLKYIEPNHFIFGGGHTRLIIETETDANGYFNNDFYILEDELGDSSTGYFELNFDDSNLNVEEFILSDNNLGSTIPLGPAVYRIYSRDTIIGNTYYLPKKTNIIVNLNNFLPIHESDYFEVRTIYPFGQFIGFNNFLNTEFSNGSSGYGTFSSNGLNTQLTPYVAEDEQNIVRIARRKNEINTIEDTIIYVSAGNSIILNYEY